MQQSKVGAWKIEVWNLAFPGQVLLKPGSNFAASIVFIISSLHNFLISSSAVQIMSPTLVIANATLVQLRIFFVDGIKAQSPKPNKCQ